MLLRDFQLRDAEVTGDGRSLVLACVPFDVSAWVDDGDGPYREGFRRGAFRHILRAPNRVELRYAHGPALPYGFGTELMEDPSHLVGVFRVAPSEQGDQVLALVRDGQLGGVSIGFLPGESEEGSDDDGPVTWRTRVKRLGEVSLTPAPSYPGAKVLSVRSDPPDLDTVAQARARWALQRLRLV